MGKIIRESSLLAQAVCAFCFLVDGFACFATASLKNGAGMKDIGEGLGIVSKGKKLVKGGVLTAVAGLAVFVALGGQDIIFAPRYTGPISDHFDGERFHNLKRTHRARSKDARKWMANRKVGPWREYQNHPPGPSPPPRVGMGQLRVTFVNHSTVLIQMDGLNILTDPIWAARASPVSWVGPPRVRPPGLRIEDLPPIDWVIISHNHYDHLNTPTLKHLNRKFRPRFLTGLGNARLLNRHGIQNVTEIDWWDTVSFSDEVKATGVPAQHFSARGLFDHNRTLWLGFVIEGPAGKVYFAGDTGVGPHIQQIRDRFGPLRLALLPIGAYKPRWFMRRVHLTPRDAVEASMTLEAQTSMGIHFGTFKGLADDSQDDPVNDLNKALKELDVSPERFWVLDFGEGRDVPPVG